MFTRICAAGTLVAVVVLCGCATTGNPTAKAAPGPNACLTSTGSRLADADTHCTAYGRSYSQTDLDQTGKTTAAGALGMVDPAVTITH